jgi:hypothetical protein
MEHWTVEAQHYTRGKFLGKLTKKKHKNAKLWNEIGHEESTC